MDKITIQKYFNIGDLVEISCPQSSILGTVVDISDAVLVIEDTIGNPTIISLNNIISCKKTDNIITSQEAGKTSDSSAQNNTDEIISKIIKAIDCIYEQYIPNREDFITSNATVVGITQAGVEVIMDDGSRTLCVKSSLVGYSRENAAIGKRVLCNPNKNDISYASLVEMTFDEMYNRFIKAVKTSPKPRTAIIASVLVYLTQFCGTSVNPYKKDIKSLLKQLSSVDALNNPNETFETIIPSKPDISKQNDVADIFVPATCEIKKYYPTYHNGAALNNRNEEIRFKDEVVIGDELIKELSNCWDTPIPVICSFKKVGKHNIASFIVTPGTVSELKLKISHLRESNQNDLADEIQMYLEENGLIHDKTLELRVDLSVESQRLLETTRKQRLIKNFNQAEKGFLTLISRKYEYDSVVRDLAMMYQEWQGPQKTIAFLEQHLPTLENKLKTYNLLAPLYQSIEDKDKSIFYMEEALKLLPAKTQKELRKREKLQKRIKNLKEKGVALSSDGIPSPLLVFDANNNTDNVLAFVSDKSIDEKIIFVQERIGQLKNSPEVPSYYMAQIQLLLDSGESAESLEIKRLIADYCRAKARNFFNEGNIISAREYLLQGISVIEREDLYYLLFISLCLSPQDVLYLYNNIFNNYEEITTKYSIQESDDVLYVILRIINEDTTMSRRMLRALYEGSSCSWVCNEMNTGMLVPKDFVEKITGFARLNTEALCSFEKNITGLLSSNNAVEISKSILDMQMPNTKQISSFDISNIYIVREIANLILDFDNKTGFDECEEISRAALMKAESTVSLIEKSPSRISTLCILPLLLKQKDLIERLLNKRFTETLPSIVIKPIDDARPIGDELEIQISISNETGSSRVHNGILSLDSVNGRDTKSQSLIYALELPLAGGATQACTFSLKNHTNSFDEIEIEYTFKYQDVRKNNREIKNRITLSINTGDDYEDFENPYIKHVKSNAVKDQAMFKGRDEIIDTICKYVLEDYKGYVLYGQKRSGKSSVLYHITQRLRAEHKAFAVEYTMGNNIVQDSESENDSIANLFYTIISEIGRAIKEVDRTVYKECGCHIIRRSEFQEYPDKTFREYLDFYRDIIVDKLHYEQDKIVLIVDEFTYLYYHILEHKISSGIMEYWKGLVESKVFSFVFAGQDAMPRFMDDFQNVFASMHPQELTYIDEQSARELIEEPIWNTKKKCSRYHPDAVNEILKLTACSPFYIMILCSELVKYARQRKRLPILANDVNSLVLRMICNESSISRKDFDNLISCGESRLDIIDKDDSIKVLKDIAVKSRNIDYYDINAINVFDKDKVKYIIEDLLRRGVLERHADISNKVKIKVGLFKRWLLNHE